MTWTRPNSSCKHRQFRNPDTARRELGRIRLDWKMEVSRCPCCKYYYWKAKANV